MNDKLVTIFLCGDVMTGRGVDQVLLHPADPRLYEPAVKSALGYVALAEDANGPIPKPVEPSYIWGDALGELDRARPDVRIINLETAVTKSRDYAPKGINYKMDPQNISCLTVARIDCCALANNHVLDWEQAGLLETLDTLESVNLKFCGAGRNLAQARAPAVMDLSGGRRVIAFSFGAVTSGIPRHWAALESSPGVNLLPDLSTRTVRRIAELIRPLKRPGDIVVASLHWGPNWGYEIPREQRTFAHGLIDTAQVDIVHGHSPHHAKGIEVYAGKPILYGCGDFLNDYEGISGYEAYRDDLALMYFVSMEASSGRLVHFEMRPLQIKNFKLHRASPQDAEWLRKVLDHEGSRLGTRVDLDEAAALVLKWTP